MKIFDPGRERGERGNGMAAARTPILLYFLSKFPLLFRLHKFALWHELGTSLGNHVFGFARCLFQSQCLAHPNLQKSFI